MIRWISILLATVVFADSPAARDTLTTLAPAAKPTEVRHALVIGNAGYTYGALKNPVNDARAMARALSQAGFEVLLLEDATQPAMQRAIRRFGDSLQQGGVGLFYYAGHGMQVRGRNFLVPVTAEIDREYEVEYTSVDVNMVLSMMDTAKNALNIVILDACRNNPFSRSFRISATGLAPMDAPSGTFIAFATSPGAIANDGSGNNGIYTKHLLAHITQPGLPIEQLFKRVRIGVLNETRGEQTPWESSSLRGEFAFWPGQAVPDQNMGELLERERERQRVETERLIEEALKRQRDEFAMTLRPGPPPPVMRPQPDVPASAAPASGTRSLPQVGDKWVYTVTDPRRRIGSKPRRYSVEVVAVSQSGILDRFDLEGAGQGQWAHQPGGYLLSQGLSLFSPYLEVFETLQPGRALPRVAILDGVACKGMYNCQATARVVGREMVLVPAGRFETVKVEVEHLWLPAMASTVAAATMSGGRKVTIWYAPAAKRAVRYVSRVNVGDLPPMDGDFSVELVSYEVN